MNVILTMNFSAGNYYFEAFKSWPDDSVDDIFVHPLPIRVTSQLSQMCTGRKKCAKKIAQAKYWPVSSFVQALWKLNILIVWWLHLMNLLCVLLAHFFSTSTHFRQCVRDLKWTHNVWSQKTLRSNNFEIQKLSNFSDNGYQNNMFVSSKSINTDDSALLQSEKNFVLSLYF